MAYKVFTNGSVLNASEINDNLMKQAVSVFSNAAARTAAITSPVEGQMTYLEDVNRYDSWNGSAWRSPYGLTLVSQVAMNAATVNLENVFTPEFTNYRIIFNNSKVTSGSAAVRLRLLQNSTPASNAGDYRYAGYGSNASTSAINAIFSGTSSTHTFLGEWANDGRFTIMDFTNPNLPELTGFTMHNFGNGGSYHYTGLHFSYTSYNGIQIFSDSGSVVTGLARIYGYRNA